MEDNDLQILSIEDVKRGVARLKSYQQNVVTNHI